MWQQWHARLVPVSTWRVTGLVLQIFTCHYVTCDRKGAPDLLYLSLRDVWQERCARLVPVITWRVTGMTHQIFTCHYVTYDRNDAPDLYLWLRRRVTGKAHQTCTCDYVTCDRNDAPDSYLWLRDACLTLVNDRHLPRSRGTNNVNLSRFPVGCSLVSLATSSSSSLPVGRVCTARVR